MKRLLALGAALLVLMLGGGALTTADAQPASPVHPPHPNLVINQGLETTYRAITPCRIADTRRSTAGIILHSTSRAFYVRGSAGFSGQGGTASGCGVPLSATAVTVNATVTGATGPGFLVNFPTGTAEPLSNFVSFQKAVTVSANPTFALAGGSTEPSLQIHASGTANAHLILDVTGYYLPQIQANVAADGTLQTNTPRIVSSSRTGTGRYAITVDRNIVGCSAVAASQQVGVAALALVESANIVVVEPYVTSNSSYEAVDAYFSLLVSC